MKSVVILISGRGSNMEAIVGAGLPAKVAAVISNRADAAGRSRPHHRPGRGTRARRGYRSDARRPGAAPGAPRLPARDTLVCRGPARRREGYRACQRVRRRSSCARRRMIPAPLRHAGIAALALWTGAAQAVPPERITLTYELKRNSLVVDLSETL